MKQVLRWRDVHAEFGLGRTTVWRQERAGTFPKRVKLGARAVGWLRTDLEAWLKGLKENQQAPNDRVDAKGE